MIIYLGADHRGFELKDRIKNLLREHGYEIIDLSAPQLTPEDDYPDYAAAVARQVGTAPEQRRGILICSSGVGMDIVANKFRNIRAGLALSADHVYQARKDDDVNILVLPADFIKLEDADKIVQAFLATPFAGDARFRRRLEKIYQIENG